jgi:hypothetical protein
MTHPLGRRSQYQHPMETLWLPHHSCFREILDFPSSIDWFQINICNGLKSIGKGMLDRFH